MKKAGVRRGKIPCVEPSSGNVFADLLKRPQVAALKAHRLDGFPVRALIGFLAIPA